MPFGLVEFEITAQPFAVIFDSPDGAIVASRVSLWTLFFYTVAF